jgi:UDP-N-acetylmuramoyl-L-alanyl-D-glutamate--2,6-diaminopimelate ligase
MGPKGRRRCRKMRLGDLIGGIKYFEFKGDPEAQVLGVSYDSRLVKPGFLFVAVRGSARDGHDFLSEAVQRGAVALVAEEFGGIGAPVSTIRVSNSRKALSQLALQYYRKPFAGMNLVGITGTNGKTTTSYILEAILLASGAKPGVIGTIDYHFAGQRWKAPVTTPESLDLMDLLRRMADAGVTDVAMEVSSHALDQERTGDCPFHVAVFTNLSRDHLDYHGSMQDYFSAKSRLFLRLKEKGGDGARAVINMEDPRGKDLASLTDAQVVAYGFGRDCHIRAEEVRVDGDGIRLRLISPSGSAKVRSSLLGDYNVLNILAASAAAHALGIGPESIAEGLGRLSGVPGRLERVKNSRSLSIVVDYAHTPDALLKVLGTLRGITQGRLITVFGCGGDRDKGKRREMGRVAGEKSDLVFITTDNPRTEDPEAIAAMIEEGVCETGLPKIRGTRIGPEVLSGYVMELDRARAIHRAVETAGRDDLIVIAGKGHEDYQIVGRERRIFDDRIVAAEAAWKER